MDMPYIVKRTQQTSRRTSFKGLGRSWAQCCFCIAFFVIATCQLERSIAIGQDETWSQDRIRQILATPTPTEINALAKSWKRADNSVENVELVESGKMAFGKQEFDVSVYKHATKDADQFTAIYVPSDAARRSLPILVEIRGVQFDYPRRNITSGSFVMTLLGDMIGQFVIVEPCLRGHQLQAIKQTHAAGGDRRDSYDGAAHDAAEALSVAISEVPAWDQTNAFSFGLSRGGGVALLHGQRDKRVTGVVAMSAPTDWTRLMASPGDDWAGRLYQVATSYVGPTNDRGAQFFEWFLQDRHQLSNQEIRQRLIASSPLYFAEQLPPTLVHQGTRDRAIPSVNAAALSDRFLSLGLDEEKYKVVFHEGAGHLLRDSSAAQQSREFLKSMMREPDKNPDKNE